MNEPVTVTYSIEEILKRIENKLDKSDAKFESKFDNLSKDLNQKLDTLSKDVTDLKVGQAELKSEVKGLSKRLDNQEFISRGVLIALIVAILGGLAKLFGLVGNP